MESLPTAVLGAEVSLQGDQWLLRDGPEVTRHLCHPEAAGQLSSYLTPAGQPCVTVALVSTWGLRWNQVPDKCHGKSQYNGIISN